MILPVYQLASSEGISVDGSTEIIYDFPPSEEPVYILGRKYSSLHGKLGFLNIIDANLLF